MKKGRQKSNNDFGTFVFNELKQESFQHNVTEIEISNLLNLSTRDLVKISQGEKELNMKEINILCSYTNIELDGLYNKYSKRKKFNK